MEKTEDDSGPAEDLLIFDEACGLSSDAAGRIGRWTRGRLRIESFRSPGFAGRHPGIDGGAAAGGFLLVLHPRRRPRTGAAVDAPGADGTPRIAAGVEALLRAASRNRLFWIILRPYFILPPVRWGVDGAFRWMMARISQLPGGCGKASCPVHGRPEAPGPSPGS